MRLRASRGGAARARRLPAPGIPDIAVPPLVDIAAEMTVEMREWLETLADGPRSVPGYGLLASRARGNGWADWWIRHLRTGEMMPLRRAEDLRVDDRSAGAADWRTVISFEGKLNCITPQGIEALSGCPDIRRASSRLDDRPRLIH